MVGKRGYPACAATAFFSCGNFDGRTLMRSMSPSAWAMTRSSMTARQNGGIIATAIIAA